LGSPAFNAPLGLENEPPEVGHKSAPSGFTAADPENGQND